MDPRLLVIAILLHYCITGDCWWSHTHTQFGESECVRANAKSCGECIQAGEQCGWCADPDFLYQGESSSDRCQKVYFLQSRHCHKIENPRGIRQIIENKDVTQQDKKMDFSDIIQIQPQKLELVLRSGEAQRFTLKYRRAENFPMDLYVLLHLSESMRDDLENLKNLGTDLRREMQSITSDFRIGFGLLVEEPVTPAKLNLCREGQNCRRPFIYKNVLKLTSDGSQFNTLMSQQQISGHPGSSEGELDAIMQVAACGDQIGWRNATRLLVFSADSGFRVAVDDKPAGSALPPNDGQCHMENNMHTAGHNYDYPAIAQLAETLKENNIQTLFAVTEESQPAYKELEKLIPRSVVANLSADSSNVIKLIIDAYHALTSDVVLHNSKLPEGVSISYVSHCKNGVSKRGYEGRKCPDISIGDEVTFDVTVTAKGCPSQGRETIKIKAQGFQQEVEVSLDFLCDCDCQQHGVPNSALCSGNGTFECGDCRCNEGRIGQMCECSTDEVRTEDLDANCRADTTTADICSNNGDCVCGTCECKKRENPEERYSGKYCECDNFNCDRSNNKLCGGHGRCECRVCVCDANYTGSACDCTMDVSTCLAKNKQICNGRGTCYCGVCKCTDPNFQGPTCEVCPLCPGVCTEHKDCVECRAFGTGDKKDTCQRECMYFNLEMVKSRIDLPQPAREAVQDVAYCKERDADGSWFYYVYTEEKDTTKMVYVVNNSSVFSGTNCLNGPLLTLSVFLTHQWFTIHC